MDESIISAVVTGAISLVGVFVSNFQSNRKIMTKIETTQTVTNFKIEGLTKEVQRHSGLVEKIPVIEEQLKNVNHRLDSRERTD